MWYVDNLTLLGAVRYRNPMRRVISVFRCVFRAILGGPLRAQVAELQRAVWRIDQKVNRHIAGDPAGPATIPDPQWPIEAFPYLRDHPMPGQASPPPAEIPPDPRRRKVEAKTDG